MSEIIVGTCYFVDLLSAQVYFDDYYDNPYTAVQQMLANEEIFIGKPPIKPNEELLIVDEGTRYAVVTKTGPRYERETY